ncbi:MAG: tRNA-dihydrouridine synthase family protein [Pseudomonadota bacterium]
MPEIKTQIILAPLQGFTDVTYRNVFCDHFSGLDEAMAPFLSTMGQSRLKPSQLKDVAPENNTKLFVIPQILGNVPEDFIFLANHLFDMGHKKINWNLGCPHLKIAKKSRGSGLLCLPDKIEAFLDAVVPHIFNTLSVKIRLGRKSREEISALLPIFDKYPLDEIILHPRTGIQMYTGSADHDAFEKAMTSSAHQFTYNGDIVDLNSFKIVQNRFADIQRFMIGRGILANPFLAEDIKGIQIKTDRIERLKAFHDDLFDNYQKIFSGPRHLTDRMKGFWSYLGPSFKDSIKPLKLILKSPTIPAYRQQVDLFFNSRPEFTG